MGTSNPASLAGTHPAPPPMCEIGKDGYVTRLRGWGLLVITLTRHGPSRLSLAAVALACAPAASMASLISRSNSAVSVQLPSSLMDTSDEYFSRSSFGTLAGRLVWRLCEWRRRVWRPLRSTHAADYSLRSFVMFCFY